MGLEGGDALGEPVDGDVEGVAHGVQHRRVHGLGMTVQHVRYDGDEALAHAGHLGGRDRRQDGLDVGGAVLDLRLRDEDREILVVWWQVPRVLGLCGVFVEEDGDAARYDGVDD